MVTEPPTPRRTRIHFGSAAAGFLVGILLAGVSSCVILAEVLSGSALGNAMASHQIVLHSAASPSGAAIAYVVDDGCGATCGCTVRIDISVGDRYFAEAYRNDHYCDLRIDWQSPILLVVTSPYNSDEILQELDILDLGTRRR